MVVVIAVGCVVFCSGFLEKGATVTDARYGCSFFSESRARAQAEDSDGEVLVSDSYLLSQGVYVRPQNTGESKARDKSTDPVAGVPVSVSYLKSRGFDQVDQAVLKNAYVWKGCTIWYQNEESQHHTVFADQSTVQDGELSFKDLVSAYEKCQIEDGVPVVNGVGGGGDNLTIQGLRCINSSEEKTESGDKSPDNDDTSESSSKSSDL